MNAVKTVMAGLALALGAASAFAQASPVGLWRTIDDQTKQERSLVRISEAGGVLTGKVEKISDPAKANNVCDDCTDARKGKPVLGMTIIEGMRKAANEPHWEGGQILDPANGKVYKLRLIPNADGKTMDVRGYMGPFYRTQHWIRVE